MDALSNFSFPHRAASHSSSSSNRSATPSAHSHSHSRSLSSTSTTSTSSTSSAHRKPSHRRTSSITTIAASRHLAASLSLAGVPPVPEIPAVYRTPTKTGGGGGHGVSAAGNAHKASSAPRRVSVESTGTVSSRGSMSGAWMHERSGLEDIGEVVGGKGLRDEDDEDEDEDDDEEEFWGCAGLVPAPGKVDDEDSFLTPMQRRRWGVCVSRSVVV